MKKVVFLLSIIILLAFSCGQDHDTQLATNRAVEAQKMENFLTEELDYIAPLLQSDKIDLDKIFLSA